MIEVCAIPITNFQAFAICTISDIYKQQQNNNDDYTYTTMISAHTSNF